MKNGIKSKRKIGGFSFILVVLFIFASIFNSMSQERSVFPQDKVDMAILENWQNSKVKIDTKNSINQDPLPLDLRENIIGIEKAVLPDRKDFVPNSLKDNLYIGPGPDTFLININYVQDGDIIIFGEGTLPGCNVTINNSIIRGSCVRMFGSNPFNPQTTISYQLPYKADVTLRIYDLQGREILTLVNENKPAGSHSKAWDGKNESGESVSSAVYFYQLRLNSNVSQIKKLLLLK